jgi:hypothetical protein
LELQFKQQPEIPAKLVRTEFRYEPGDAAQTVVHRVALETHQPEEPGAKRFQWREGARALAVCFLRHESRRKRGLDRYIYRRDQPSSLAGTLLENVRRTDDPKKNRWLREVFGSDLPTGPPLKWLFEIDEIGGWVALRAPWKESKVVVKVNGNEVIDPKELDQRARELEEMAKKAAPILPAELDGELELLVWDRQKGCTIPVADNRLPLHVGAELMLQVNLNRPAFVYLIWITSRGEAKPLYPWENFDWTTPLADKKIKSLLLPPPGPEGGRQCYPVDTGLGTETAALLARDEQLWPDFTPRLERLFKGLAKDFAKLHLVDSRSPFPFQCASTATLMPSAIRLGAPQPVNDPFLNLRQRLSETLGSRFSLIKGVCFANAGETRAVQ